MADKVMGDVQKKKFLKDVKEASRDKLILSEWESEKMAELVKSESIKNATLEGEEMGFEQGIEQGIEQENRTLILAMINQGASFDFVSKVTKKTISEIKEIVNSMKE